MCGENERYSPPVVMFLDHAEDTYSSPLLLVGVDHPTQRSQFLAHFSFTSIHNKDTGLKLRGAKKLTGSGMWKILEDIFLSSINEVAPMSTGRGNAPEIFLVRFHLQDTLVFILQTQSAPIRY